MNKETHICDLCERKVPRITEHHLIPREKVEDLMKQSGFVFLVINKYMLYIVTMNWLLGLILFHDLKMMKKLSVT